MTEQVLIEVIKQGGFALLSAGMFVTYRMDSTRWAQKQEETVAALMEFSRATATTLTRIDETQRSLVGILARIEGHLSSNHLCPVTQVSSELLRDVNSTPGRRQVDRVVRDAVASAVLSARHDGDA